MDSAQAGAAGLGAPTKICKGYEMRDAEIAGGPPAHSLG